MVDPQDSLIAGLRQLSDRLLLVPAAAALPISIIINAGGSYEKMEAEASELGDLSLPRSCGPPLSITVIVDGIETGTASCFVVASANGLAG